MGIINRSVRSRYSNNRLKAKDLVNLFFSMGIYVFISIPFHTLIPAQAYAKVYVDEFGRSKDYLNEPANYEERHKPRVGKGPYVKDLNVLVYDLYTKKRFGMPEKWLSDEVEGAHAATWRMEATGRKRCQVREGTRSVFLPMNVL